MATKGRATPAQVQKYLKGVDYPASKNDLISHARKRQAPKEIISLLEAMPNNEFGAPTDVSKGIGEMNR